MIEIMRMYIGPEFRRGGADASLYRVSVLSKAGACRHHGCIWRGRVTTVRSSLRPDVDFHTPVARTSPTEGRQFVDSNRVLVLVAQSILLVMLQLKFQDDQPLVTVVILKVS